MMRFYLWAIFFLLPLLHCFSKCWSQFHMSTESCYLWPFAHQSMHSLEEHTKVLFWPLKCSDCWLNSDWALFPFFCFTFTSCISDCNETSFHENGINCRPILTEFPISALQSHDDCCFWNPMWCYTEAKLQYLISVHSTLYSEMLWNSQIKKKNLCN